ncbi:restriction endonuclease subunit S [Brevibacterium sp. SMBL_HHYL_HB1]|uniref:restriction endonuclease subunit S n=1 Tax=Brevibacterium sp. SMBL_HHYL_HB1 TaxID=2777556 RepID=UPI001BA4E88F|nr:restriction endonuclease subunit S [Brevibacterium sp. SMBL_HHYL_HB1]QUL77888.1 restriction endonuclease subunit S [Brevibacterium sp. SMBL_HHYL_HB1]
MSDSTQSWQSSKMGRHMLINDGLVDPRSEPWASKPLIAPNHIESGTARIKNIVSARDQGADSGKYFARQGQVLYSKIRPALNKVAIAPMDCLCSADMYAMSSRHPNDDSRFLVYYMLSRPFLDFTTQISMRVKMPKVNREELSAAPWLRPPAEEQRAIADYLDKETAQIDALVKKQEEFIGLLAEKRAGLIFHAVTRGLRNGASLKASGLSWVEAIPRTWQVLNIRRVAEMKTGHTPSRSVPEYWENTSIPWFTLADVWQLRDGKRTYLGETSSQISSLGLSNSAAELLPSGTVVLSRTASVGFSGIMPVPMATSQDFWNWICSPLLLPEYLLQVFRAMREEFSVMMIGSTHKTIYQHTAAGIRIPLPPVEEQRAIVKHIEDQASRIDSLIAKAEEHIVLAKERRAALITAAVTGQFDVRTARKVG